MALRKKSTRYIKLKLRSPLGKKLLLCHLPAEGKAGESGEEGVSVSGFEYRIEWRGTNIDSGVGGFVLWGGDS